MKFTEGPLCLGHFWCTNFWVPAPPPPPPPRPTPLFKHRPSLLGGGGGGGVMPHTPPAQSSGAVQRTRSKVPRRPPNPPDGHSVRLAGARPRCLSVCFPLVSCLRVRRVPKGVHTKRVRIGKQQGAHSKNVWHGPARTRKWLRAGGWGRLPKRLGGGYCRLRMPLRLALGVRGTAAGPWLGALEGGGGYLRPLPMHPCPYPKAVLTRFRACVSASDPWPLTVGGRFCAPGVCVTKAGGTPGYC